MPTTNYAALGIVTTSNVFYLPRNLTNWFGLGLKSVMVAKAGPVVAETAILYEDDIVSRDPQAAYRFYPEFDQPQLGFVDWRFVVFSWNWNSTFPQWPGNFGFIH